MSDARSECLAASRPGLVGDPIDVVTGAVLDRVADFRLADEPLPFVWRRSYDSTRSDSDRGIGWGHAHELDHALEWDLDGVLYRRPHAASVAFPHAFADGLVGVGDGCSLERLDVEHYVVRAHGEPDRFFRRARGASAAPLVRIASGAACIRLEHDREGRLVEVVCASRRRLRLSWDRAHLVDVVLLDGGRGPKSLVRYRYDERGCLIEGRDAYQQTFRFAYDASRRLVKKTDRRGYSFEFEYDRSGRCVRSSGEDGVLEVRLEHRTQERVTIVRESSGGEWVYQYDTAGALLQVIDPLGGIRMWSRDATGRIVSEIDPTGGITTFEHDARGAAIAKVDPSGRRIALPETSDRGEPDEHRVPACALEWELGDLEPLGFVPAVVLSAHTWLEEERAQLRTPSSEPALAAIAPTRDEQGLLLAEERGSARRTWAYDPNGNVRRFTDREGRSYSSEYASWNHRVRDVDPLGRETRYTYTRAEKLAALLDPGGTRSEYEYDAKDRLVEVRRAGSPRDRYAYDLADRLTEKRDAFGRLLLEVAYGPDGRIAERTLASGDVHAFRHDGRGRITAAASDAGQVTFAYAHRGARAADRRDGIGVEHEFLGARRVRSTVLGRFEVRYGHEGHGRVRIVAPTGACLALTRVAPGIVRREMGAGGHELAQYAPDGRCLSKTASTPGAERWSRDYAYSAEGDLLIVHDSARGTTHYAHDAAHQLAISRTDTEPVAAYRYDAAGNLLEKPGLRGVLVGLGNRLHAANDDTFEYDHRQNLAVRRSRDGRETRFHHDARDQLVRIDLPDGSTWHAQYDAIGRRTRKELVRGGVSRETTFWWEGDRLAAERLPDGRVRIYVYADGFSLVPPCFVEYASLDAGPSSGRTFDVFGDHQGTPELVRARDGEVVWWARRDPYGVVVQGGHDFHQPFRFPGHYWDEDTGLHYNRFRYYSPELGRYLQSDPWGISGGTNTHAYTENPLRQVDVRGLDCGGPGRPVRAREDRPDAEGTVPRRRQLADLDRTLHHHTARALEQLGLAEERSTHPLLAELDPELAALAARSPTLMRQLDHLATLGYVITYDDPGGHNTGAYCETARKRIRLERSWSAAAQTSTLAHEVGHALHGADPHISPHDVYYAQDYVERNRMQDLRNEGDAQINAAGITDEIYAHGGPRLPIPGEYAEEYRATYERYRNGAMTRADAVDRIANRMRHETASGDPPQTYQQRYAERYIEHWNKLFPDCLYEDPET